MRFSRQEYWGGLAFLPPGDLPDSGIKLVPLPSPALAGRFFITEPPTEPQFDIDAAFYFLWEWMS